LGRERRGLVERRLVWYILPLFTPVFLNTTMVVGVVGSAPTARLLTPAPGAARHRSGSWRSVGVSASRGAGQRLGYAPPRSPIQTARSTHVSRLQLYTFATKTRDGRPEWIGTVGPIHDPQESTRSPPPRWRSHVTHGGFHETTLASSQTPCVGGLAISLSVVSSSHLILSIPLPAPFIQAGLCISAPRGSSCTGEPHRSRRRRYRRHRRPRPRHHVAFTAGVASRPRSVPGGGRW
jgi:hypothetical protein